MTIKNKLPESGVVAVVGLQWGDEGKGKLVDLIADWADIVARGTGGANAGHTIVIDGVSHVFHLVPSAILRDNEGVVNVIGRGVAFDPHIMLDELSELDALGVSYNNLKISRDAHLVLPQHILLDHLREANAGNGKIGTTLRGIGPLYTCHVARYGLKVVDLLNPQSFREKLERNLAYLQAELKTSPETMEGILKGNDWLAQFFSNENIDVDKIVAVYTNYGNQLKRHIIDTDTMLREAVADKKKVLLEGAQATLLSINHGLYPMVTSSDSTIAGLASGVGLRESVVDIVYGVVKAPYMTRVGEGVFPTELGPAEDADYPKADINASDPLEQCVAMRRIGGEFGATTKRPRRIGWIDLPLLRYALKSGGDQLALTKVDVLDSCEEIHICTHYTYQGPEYDLGDRVLAPGDTVEVAFGDNSLMSHIVPEYQILPGWKSSTEDIRSYDELPAALKEIVAFISDEASVPVGIISVGPERDQTIVL